MGDAWKRLFFRRRQLLEKYLKANQKEKHSTVQWRLTQALTIRLECPASEFVRLLSFQYDALKQK